MSKVFERDCAKTCKICGQRADDLKSTTEMTTTPTKPTTTTTKSDIKWNLKNVKEHLVKWPGKKTDAISTMETTHKDIFVMLYCILLPVE